MMNRRTWLSTLGLIGMTPLLPSRSTQGLSDDVSAATSNEKAWLFWDLWHLDRRQNLEHCLGRPTWRRDAVFVDDVDGLAAWPSVFRDQQTGRWRMIYTSRWRPYMMMLADSGDGIQFKTVHDSGIRPEGEQRAPYHIFTLPDGSCGGMYHDPIAADGYPYKIFCHQGGKFVLERALADPAHRWHKIAKQSGLQSYMHDEFTLVSRDGLHWEIRPDLAWSLPGWHPEPPVFGFYNHHQKKHMMTVRPGWGDRRVCIQSSEDFKHWSGPELLLQPDPSDPDLCEFYGMPVFPYAGAYVGLLWIFHCEQAEPTGGFNRHIGPIDCQLTYSYGGLRFQRGPREPFIPLNEPGEHGCGGIEPSCLVETENEIRIYSSASKTQHGKNFLARKAGLRDFESILVHTLRRDGFMYLRSRGNWASFISKPLVWLGGELTMNAKADTGEVHYQLTGIDSKALDGFTFEDCIPFDNKDSQKHVLQWRGGSLENLAGRIVRLEVKFRDARLYAFRGRFHFIDAQDWLMIRDGQPIDASM